MSCSRIIPLFTTDQLAVLKDYYLNHFDFKVTFENESYIGIQASGAVKTASQPAEIGFMLPNPGDKVFDGQGVTLCFEAPDVDAAYKRAKQEGLSITTDLNDAPWGDRYFTVIDPIGISLYIYAQITPAEDYQAYFKE